MPDDVAGVVNAIAWEEIERLGACGLPACDVQWRFVPDGVGWWGFADAAVRPGEAFAEAVTVALTPDGEGRTWFSDEHVPEENVRARADGGTRGRPERWSDMGSSHPPDPRKG